MTENHVSSSTPFAFGGGEFDLEHIQQEIAGQRAARPALAGSYVAPRTPTEAKLAEIWADLLDIEPVGVQDDFFALGGHSILVAQFLARVYDAFQVEFPVDVSFDDDAVTIEKFAHLIEENRIQQVDFDEIAGLMDELDRLSPEEIDALLNAG
ncbi:MAG: phosphopantetheine-binding protein [Chloroflexota bacterium]